MASLLNNEGGNAEAAEHPTVKDALRKMFATNEEEDNNKDGGIHDLRDSNTVDKNSETFDYGKNHDDTKTEANDNNIDDSFGSSNESDANKIDLNVGSGGTYFSGSSDFTKK